jgi:hypothetical protein
MKSIQTILTLILVVLMVGMMPNLADAKKKTQTITISPDKFVPETPANNYEITPNYASSTNANFCRYWVKIQLPKKAKSIQNFSYFHAGYGGSTYAYLCRCRPSNWQDYLGYASANASGGQVYKITDDTINNGDVIKGYTYYLLLYVSGDNAYILGAEVTINTK